MALRALPFPADCPEATCLADLCDQWRIVARQPIMARDLTTRLRPTSHRLDLPPLVWEYLGAFASNQAAEFRRQCLRGLIVKVTRREGPEFVLYAKRAQPKVEEVRNKTLAIRAPHRIRTGVYIRDPRSA